MLPVVWSVDTRDYDPGVTAKQLVARVKTALRPGSIILLHDGGGNRRKTVAALPRILDEIAAARLSRRHGHAASERCSAGAGRPGGQM